MSSPVSLHQLIAGEIYRQIANFILDGGGRCMAYIAPLDIQLDRDDRTMVQPDVMILCNHKEQIKNGRGYGAPDFILEVISPSTRRRDCYLKLHKYENAGSESIGYWIRIKQNWKSSSSRKVLFLTYAAWTNLSRSESTTGSWR